MARFAAIERWCCRLFSSTHANEQLRSLINRVSIATTNRYINSNTREGRREVELRSLALPPTDRLKTFRKTVFF